MNTKEFFRQLFKDKNHNYSLRELVVAILLLVLIVSWIGQQFFNKPVTDNMFFTFASLIASGTFGYSFEKKTGPDCPPQQKL